MSKRFKNNLPIFVFVFKLNGEYYLSFPISFNFVYVGAVVIVFVVFIGKCVLIVRILQCFSVTGYCFLKYFFVKRFFSQITHSIASFLLFFFKPFNNNLFICQHVIINFDFLFNNWLSSNDSIITASELNII